MADIRDMVSQAENERLGRLILDAKNQARRVMLKGASSLMAMKKRVEVFTDDLVAEWCRNNYPNPNRTDYEKAIEFFSNGAKEFILEEWEKVR